MAFFCNKSGARILAPGTCNTAGGEIPAHRGTKACDAAEYAALRTLHALHPHPNEVPGPKALGAAVDAAREAFVNFSDAAPPERARQHDLVDEPALGTPSGGAPTAAQPAPAPAAAPPSAEPTPADHATDPAAEPTQPGTARPKKPR